MIVIDLLGNKSKWKMDGNVILHIDTRNRSSIHIQARNLLKDIFPTTLILEEVPIYLRPGHIAYLDFYINQFKLAIEVHGIQHYKYNSFFHSSAADFMSQKKRDIDKKQWCENNLIKYIEFPYNEDIEQWKIKITH